MQLCGLFWSVSCSHSIVGMSLKYPVNEIMFRYKQLPEDVSAFFGKVLTIHIKISFFLICDENQN